MNYAIPLLCGLTLLLGPAAPGHAAERSEPTRKVVYKTVGDVDLALHVFEPDGHAATDRRPAIVFFFGGGWRSGSPSQFYPHAEYLASRGMVAMAADYRVSSRHNVKAVDCVADARSAIRWVRENADRLGADPERIAAAGGSAGGHLAACAGTLSPADPEDPNSPSKPNALVLFNPVVVLAPVDDETALDLGRMKNLEERMGADPLTLSPYHHIAPGVPPTLIFHGKDDATVPYRTVQAFTKAMNEAGNRCELVGFDGKGHGFFNFSRGDGVAYLATLVHMDRFLQSLGFLKGEPTIGDTP